MPAPPELDPNPPLADQIEALRRALDDLAPNEGSLPDVALATLEHLRTRLDAAAGRLDDRLRTAIQARWNAMHPDPTGRYGDGKAILDLTLREALERMRAKGAMLDAYLLPMPQFGGDVVALVAAPPLTRPVMASARAIAGAAAAKWDVPVVDGGEPRWHQGEGRADG